MRFVSITDIDKQMLEAGFKNHTSHVVCPHLYSVLLSSESQQIKDIASIYKVRTRTIYDWMNKWERHGIMGLLTKRGQGRPPILSINVPEVVEIVKKNATSCSKSSKNL